MNARILRLLAFVTTLAMGLLAAGSLPAAAQGPRLQVDMNCSPGVFRPNEWVAFDCHARLTNAGITPIEGMEAGITNQRGTLPDFYRMLYVVNGEIRAPGTIGGNGVLQPGDTNEVRLVTLLRMPSEGDYQGDWRISSGGAVLASLPIAYSARAAAEYPRHTLDVSRVPVPRRAGDPVSYQTTITNGGDSAVDDVKFYERHEGGVKLVASEPEVAPSAEDGNLLTLVIDSLQPGETATIRASYEPEEAGDCPTVRSEVLVEATVGGGTELYAAHVDPSFFCEALASPIASAGPVGSPPSTGEGASGGEFESSWLAVSLFAGGVALITTAFITRRRRWV
jgi:hypothetical protein